MEELVDRIVQEQFRETYEARIKIQLTSEGEREYELVSDEVMIGFDIDVEYRSWGIKDITIKPLGNITFDVLIDEDEADTLKIDVEDAKIEDERGYEYIKPLWIDIKLDDKGNVVEKVLHVSSK